MKCICLEQILYSNNFIRVFEIVVISGKQINAFRPKEGKRFFFAICVIYSESDFFSPLNDAYNSISHKKKSLNLFWDEGIEIHYTLRNNTGTQINL